MRPKKIIIYLYILKKFKRGNYCEEKFIDFYRMAYGSDDAACKLWR